MFKKNRKQWKKTNESIRKILKPNSLILNNRFNKFLKPGESIKTIQLIQNPTGTMD